MENKNLTRGHQEPVSLDFRSEC